MYNPQDPVGKVTETMAKLFAVMADEVLQEMGQEKGEAVVKRAVRRFANMRAQKIIENIKRTERKSPSTRWRNIPIIRPMRRGTATPSWRGIH